VEGVEWRLVAKLGDELASPQLLVGRRAVGGNNRVHNSEKVVNSRGSVSAGRFGSSSAYDNSGVRRS
jgi:hypothetical protein